VEKLLEALRIIRDTCSQHGNCHHCPLRDADVICTLRKEPPAGWKLAEKVPETRLFREEA